MFSVVIISPSGLPTPSVKGGAIQTLVTSLIETNEAMGSMKIDLYTPKDNKLKNIPIYKNCKIIQIDTKNVFIKFYCFALRIFKKILRINKPTPKPYMMRINRLLKDKTADFVLFESGYDDIVSFNRRSNFVLYHIHSDYIKKESRFLNILDSNVDCYLPISRYIKTELIKSGLSEKKITVFINSINVSLYSFRISKKRKSEIRLNYGIEQEDFLFTYCGRLSKEKGVLELIKAFNMLNCSNAKLLVIGGSTFSSNKKTDYVQELYKEANNNHNIIFSGYIDHHITYELIQISDIGVIPSICGEACSLSLLEYTRSGIPTIAADVGGIKEFSTRLTTFVEKNENFVRNLASAMENAAKNYDAFNKEIDLNEFDSIYSPEAYYKNFVGILNCLKKDL